MKPEDVSAGFRKSAVEDNIEIYRKIFSGTPASSATDPYWQRALALYHQLPADQREVLFEIMRQVAVDTTSNILGIIDGSVYFEGGSGKFILTDDQGSQLSGDLQGLFLQEDESKAD